MNPQIQFLVSIRFLWCRAALLAIEYQRALLRLSLVLVAMTTAARDLQATDAIEKRPLNSPSVASVGVSTRFELVDEATSGLHFRHEWLDKPLPQFKDAADRNYISEGGGVTIGDVNGDGLPDVFLTRPFGGGRLFRNLGSFRFEDVTDEAGLADPDTWSAGTSFVDVDNDGDLDLFVCAYHTPNRLFINDGKGHFTEESEKYGVAFRGASVMMAFADYDLDGDLDGYLAVNRYEFDDDGKPLPKSGFVAIHRRPFQGYSVAPRDRDQWDVITRPDTGTPVLIKAGQFNRLYQNESGKRFVDVAADAGVASNGLSLAATWWDYNQDGLPDLYVANDFFGADQLYENQGDGTFVDVAPEKLRHTPWFSMGSDVGDINNDGLLDLIATDMAGTDHYKSKTGMGDMDKTGWFLEMGRPRQYMRNAVYLNAGSQRPLFEIAHQANLDASDWTWSPKFGDFDCDGLIDVFITNGMTGDFFNSDLQADMANNRGVGRRFPIKRDPNKCFRNAGDLSFEDVSREWGLGESNITFGAAVADLDDDGDLDIVTNRYNDTAQLYRNQTQSGNRVSVSLRGTKSNRFGIDALVRITTSKGQQVRYHTLSRGFMSTNGTSLHFGVGDETRLETLTVTWPGGQTQVFRDLPTNYHFVITEATHDSSDEVPAGDGREPLYEESDELNWRHNEIPNDDFALQPLLPNKLSQLGPGVAVADVDSDGDDDLYLGGGAGQAGRIMKNEAGVFRLLGSGNSAFEDDAKCEDMGAVFFDADSDGDQDLYVVSGSYEYPAENDALQDRLYLNIGKGQFKRAPTEAIGAGRDSGSCVVAADYDRDGDLDLFVGGRVVPGQYPVSPISRLLRNDTSTKGVLFTDATETDSVGLAEAGMVTSALWSDVDSDKDADLLVTYEWGPVRLFQNDNGVLKERTREALLSDRLGWWNAINGADIDHDGDIDYAVTNTGLNTKYHPNPAHPVHVYYGDFEHNGGRRIVEAEVHGSKVLPVRGRSRSSTAMPFIAERFKSFHDFALADLVEIYSQQCLDQSLVLTVNELRSGVLVNDGTGRFSFRPLPELAQIAPGFGVEFCYANADHNVDLYVVQNFFGPQRETGRMDGGLSLLLLGDGNGGFSSVWPAESGVVIDGDAKGLSRIDLNSDGLDDFVVTVNNGAVRTFQNRCDQGKWIRVRLVGDPRNPTGVGAKVSVVSREDGHTLQATEVYAGGGYLSQSSASLSFPIGEESADIVVSWPNGGTDRMEAPLDDSGVVYVRRRKADKSADLVE